MYILFFNRIKEHSCMMLKRGQLLLLLIQLLCLALRVAACFKADSGSFFDNYYDRSRSPMYYEPMYHNSRKFEFNKGFVIEFGFVNFLELCFLRFYYFEYLSLHVLSNTNQILLNYQRTVLLLYFNILWLLYNSRDPRCYPRLLL